MSDRIYSVGDRIWYLEGAYPLTGEVIAVKELTERVSVYDLKLGPSGTVLANRSSLLMYPRTEEGRLALIEELRDIEDVARKNADKLEVLDLDAPEEEPASEEVLEG